MCYSGATKTIFAKYYKYFKDDIRLCGAFRDGLQTYGNTAVRTDIFRLPPTNPINTAIELDELKYDLMKMINTISNVHTIEIGSFANPKVLPIMRHTKTLLDYGIMHYPNINYTILVPNYARLQECINDDIYQKVSGFSYITSVSQAFQQKNARQTLDESRKNIIQCINFVGSEKRAKVYISCITECPIAGHIPDETIYNTIKPYIIMAANGEIDEICLADTCATLSSSDYTRIIETLYMLGLPYSKMGLHLHVNMNIPERVSNARRILYSAFEHGIGGFDVTTMSQGGCSVTMKSPASNLDAEFFNTCCNEWLAQHNPSLITPPAWFP